MQPLHKHDIPDDRAGSSCEGRADDAQRRNQRKVEGDAAHRRHREAEHRVTLVAGHVEGKAYRTGRRVGELTHREDGQDGRTVRVCGSEQKRQDGSAEQGQRGEHRKGHDQNGARRPRQNSLQLGLLAASMQTSDVRGNGRIDGQQRKAHEQGALRSGAKDADIGRLGQKPEQQCIRVQVNGLHGGEQS